jgi:preprotein translocase subunit YajC
MTNLNLILMAPAGGAQSGQSSYSFLIMMVLMIVIFYFFMIRPQVKRQKELANYRNQLKKGDKVITTGGIYGRIHEISDNSNTILLEVDTNVHIRVDRSAILKDPTDLAQQK